MAQHHAVDIDPKEVERALNGWHNFGKLMKYAVIGVIGILALLGMAFIDW